METQPPTLTNPYHPDYADDAALPTAPFAGRRAVIGRLYQALADTARPCTITVVGRRHFGKTALLEAFDGAFGAGFIGAYLSLASPPDTEAELLLLIAQAITEALVTRGLNVSRLAALEPPLDDARAWLLDSFLPAALAALRPARPAPRLILLLDDLDRLIHIVRSGRLPMDLPTFLRGLLDRFPSLGFVMTLTADHEDDLPLFAPLADPLAVVRLDALAAEDVHWLLTEPARGCYAVPDDCTAAIHRATGGHPALAQQFGYQLFRRWEAVPELNVVTLDDIKTLTPIILRYAEDDYRGTWTRLNPNERLTLTAIAGVLTDDPLRVVSVGAAAGWLLDSDHPLDAVTVASAFRALEFRDLVRPVKGGVILTAGLFQLWLRQNAGRDAIRVVERPLPRGLDAAGVAALTAAEPDRRPVPVTWMIGVGALLGLIIAIVALAILTGQGTIALPNFVPVPTVTLVP